MATILARIKQRVRDGNYVITDHCQDELEKDFFSGLDAVAATLNASEFDRLTSDESPVRYVVFGVARDGRDLNVVVFLQQSTVVLKTAYESYS